MKVTVYTVFGKTLEVDEDEAQSLARQGLLRDTPADTATAAPQARVTVVPSFTGRPMEMGADEAASLAAQGLLLEQEATETPPEPPAKMPTEQPPVAEPLPQEAP